MDMNSWNSGSRDHDLGFGDTDSNTCWRTTVTITCPDFPLWGGRDGKLVSGTLNWLPVRWETDAVNQLRHKYLPLPRGCLCLYHGQRDINSWTLLLNMSFEHAQVFPPWQLLAAPLSCMFENDDTMLLANYPRSQYIFYNRRDNRIFRAEDFNDKVLLYSHDYVQSLFSWALFDLGIKFHHRKLLIHLELKYSSPYIFVHDGRCC
ncbi:hypothetical protein HKD37_08G021678 [Glycine soja]